MAYCPHLPLLALLAGAVTACVPDGNFPSLAQRPAEREAPVEEPVRPVVAVASDESLRRTVATLIDQAGEGDRSFDAAYPSAAAAVDAAGEEGSESWVEAEQAISRLEAARAQTMHALIELDQLAIDRADLPTDPGDEATIVAVIARVERLAEAQQQRLDRLRAGLSRR